MTLSKEADEIRSEVATLRKGPGRKYTRAMRERVLAWMERALESGMDMMECSRALGIAYQRLDAWRAEDERRAATVVPEAFVPRPGPTTAMVPVALRDEFSPFGPSIGFSAPGGYRIDGLTLEQAIGLLRLFG